MSRKLFQYIVVVILVVSLPGIVLACPTCKQSLAEATNNPNLVRGYGWSIMFMMSAPFLILAGLGSYFYYEIRRARARQALGGAPYESATVIAAVK
jgi:hypothetical protein